MFSFTLRRLLQLLFVLWGGATILFLLFFTLPSDPATIMAGGNNRTPDPQVVENIREKYGFDEPIIVQYKDYMVRLLHGDLGHSYRTGESVSDIVRERLPVSLRLASWAITIEIVVGISSGMLSARRRNSVADSVTTTVAVVASAIPVFVLGYLMKQVTGVYAFEHHWPEWARMPTLGFGPNEWYLGIIPSPEQFTYLIQPAIVLASVSTAVLARITRTSMLETMRYDHVRTARSKGLEEKHVQRRHILRNAMLPVVTVVGLDFGTAVGAAVLTETVFNIPGLGSKIVQAAQTQDLPIVLGLSLVVMAIYGLASLAVDLSYAYLDPRIRLHGDA